MMNSVQTFRLGNTALLLLLLSSSARAGITLLREDAGRSDFLGRLNFRVGGSIRPQIEDVMGGKDRGSFKRDLYDGGTRFRFHLRFRLDDDLHMIAYSEVGVNIPALIGWNGHYARGARNTGNRQLYGGLRSKRWGELTYGHRHSIYYDAVTSKTDIWGDDLHSEPVSVGFDQNYDGSWNALRTFNYLQHVGSADLYASYLLAEHSFYKDGVRYKRHGGESLGINYHFTPDLSWGLVWSMTHASVSRSKQHRAHFTQQLLGSGFSWTPGNWTLAVTGGWYHHFVPLQGRPIRRYFANRGWGMSYYVAHTFPVNRYGLKGVMPYYFGVQLRAGDHHQRYQRENGLAVALLLYKGFRIDYQHVFRSSNDHIGDINFVRFRYDF